MKSNYDLVIDNLIKQELGKHLSSGSDTSVIVLSPKDLAEYTTLAGTLGTFPHFDNKAITQLEKRGITHIYALAVPTLKKIITLVIPKLPKPLGYVLENSVNKNGGSLQYDYASIDRTGQYLAAFFESE